MTGKLLSVIIPSYNMEALLPKCLDSLIVSDKALLDALDVLVVNDGSTDRTSEIAHGYAETYPDVVRVIDKPNGHYGSCINAALPQATGAYVKILDADDFVDTAAFQSLLAALREEADSAAPADAVISDWVSVNPDGVEVERSSYDFLPAGKFSMAEFNRLREGKGLIGIHAIVYRRAIFSRFAYRQTEGCCYTDTEWFSIPMAYAEWIRYVPRCVTHYLVGRDGQSMDPKVFARDFHVLGKIALKMIRDFQSLNAQASPAGRTYLAGRIHDFLILIYNGALFKWNGFPVAIDLKAFDVELKALAPDFYHALDAIKAPSTRFDYCYIRDWRRRHSKVTVRFGLYMIYTRVISPALALLHRKLGQACED